jgi:hypothetical protein
MIALGLGLTQRVVNVELSKMHRAGLVSETGVRSNRIVWANLAVARNFLETIHGLARVLRPI